MTWTGCYISIISCCHVTSHFILSNAIFLSLSLNPKSSCLLTCVSRVSFFMHPLFGFLLYVQTKNQCFNRNCLKWVIGSMPYKDQLILTKTLSTCYHLIFNDVWLFCKMLHGPTELPFPAYYFFKVTTSRKSTIFCTTQTAKKWQTEKLLFHRVEKPVNELIRLGVDIVAPLESFKRRVKELLLEKTVSIFDQLISFSWFLKCTCSKCPSWLDIIVFIFTLSYLRELILSSSSTSDNFFIIIIIIIIICLRGHKKIKNSIN